MGDIFHHPLLVVLSGEGVKMGEISLSVVLGDFYTAHVLLV